MVVVLCPDPIVVDLRTQCHAVVRSDKESMASFSCSVLSELQGAISATLLELFSETKVRPMKNLARKESSRDLRYPVLWNFVDLFASLPQAGCHGPFGIPGAAMRIGMDRNTLKRYWSNSSCKDTGLLTPAVVVAELKILQYILASARAASPKSSVKVSFRINGTTSQKRTATNSIYSWELPRPGAMPGALATASTDAVNSIHGVDWATSNHT